MTLDDIRMFLAIARTGSLTAAAQSLYVSQPALSKRLARFEQELGATLFERGQGAHSLTLTPAGKLLIPFAEKWDDLQEEMSLLHDLSRRKHFFVDTVDSVSDAVLAEPLCQFCAEHPEIEVVTRCRERYTSYAGVQEHTADVAFVAQEQFYQNVSTNPLFRERFVLVTADTALTEPVNAADLPRERELVVHWGAGFLRWRQQRLNIARHPNVTLSVIGMALPFLRQGGWIIAPQTIGDAVASVMEELRCLPLLDPPPERTVYFAEEYGRHHEATDLLLELIHAKLRNRPGIRWLLG